MKRSLVRWDSPVLKERAVEVGELDSGILTLLEEMEEIMFLEGGVGISAPQVGVSMRIMIITDGEKRLLKMINPEVISAEGREEVSIEGCLTYPGLFLGVWRPLFLRAKWRNELGGWEEETLEGTLAKVFWHELDHLNGVTLRNRASNLKWNRWLKMEKEKTLPRLTRAAR